MLRQPSANCEADYKIVLKNSRIGIFLKAKNQEEIDKFIGKEYSRVRVGIGKPNTQIAVTDYVLKNFDEDEMQKLKKITINITDSLSILLDKKLDLFSSTVNGN